MAAELVMAGPGKPVRHAPHHNLESFFYVLLGISVLYDEPRKLKPEDKLAECFDEYFNTFQPSLQKTITVQSQLGWSANICKYISPYFRPLIDLFNTLREKIILPMAFVKGSFNFGEKTITHDDMVKCLLDALSKLPDESWIAKASPDRGGDELQPYSVKSNSMVDRSNATTSPQSSLELTSENSSSADSSVVSSESDPDILRMRRPSPIRQTSGPGFTSSSVSSGGTRRQHSGPDTDYIERKKQPRLALESATEQPLTRRFVATEPPNLRSAKRDS